MNPAHYHLIQEKFPNIIIPLADHTVESFVGCLVLCKIDDLIRERYYVGFTDSEYDLTSKVNGTFSSVCSLKQCEEIIEFYNQTKVLFV